MKLLKTTCLEGRDKEQKKMNKCFDVAKRKNSNIEAKLRKKKGRASGALEVNKNGNKTNKQAKLCTFIKYIS